MKALVTGGAGFIGSHITDQLISRGYDVSIIDNLSSGKPVNLNPKARLYQGSISDRNFLQHYFETEKPNIVFHLAAQPYVSLSTKEPQTDASINIIGSINLLDLAREQGVRKIIYSNSGGASYGNPQYVPIDEEHPINPLCPYGISKHTVEHYLTMYQLNHGLEFTSLRYANVYGPRQDPHGEGGVVSIFTQHLLNNQQPVIFGDGTQVRDYCFIDDVVEANLLAIYHGSNECYNIGTGIGTSTQEIFNIIKEEVNSKLEPIYTAEREGDVKTCILNPKKFEALGWKSTVNIRDGIKKTVDYLSTKKAKNT